MSLARVGWLDSFRDVGGLEWTDALGTVTFCGGGVGRKGWLQKPGDGSRSITLIAAAAGMFQQTKHE